MTIKATRMAAMLDALSAARANGTPALRPSAARADLRAALSVYRRETDRLHGKAVSKSDRQKRQRTFKALAGHLRAAEDLMLDVTDKPGSIEPLRAAWQQATGEDAYADDVTAAARAARGTFDAWATAAELALDHATGARGRPSGSDLQRLMCVLAGLYLRHTGKAPATGDPDNSGFLELIRTATLALGEDGPSAVDGMSALRAVMHRADWPEYLAWTPDTESAAHAFAGFLPDL